MIYKRSLLFYVLSFTLIALTMVGCSVGYVARAAYEQCRILCVREPIESVVANPETSPEVARKLRLVLEARDFAVELGLQPGDSYTKYADIGRDVLSWVVVGSKKDSFTLKTWWFPIVGTVPYKGFFHKDDALAEAAGLEEQDYETSVRETSAYSTLGWFNDPVLSTMLKSSAEDLVNTIIHESVHATIWIGNSVSFNESLANFIGNVSAVKFFERALERCSPDQCAFIKEQLEAAKQSLDIQQDLSQALNAVYTKLSELYASPITAEEKIAKRQGVFDQAVKEFRTKYPKARALSRMHNAEIMQLVIYYTKTELFNQLFIYLHSDLKRFIEEIIKLKDDKRVRDGVDPYTVMTELMRSE